MLLVHEQVVHSTAASFSDLQLPHGNIAPTPRGFVSACCCRYHVGSACWIEEMDQTLGWTVCIRVLISEVLDAGGYNPILVFFLSHQIENGTQYWIAKPVVWRFFLKLLFDIERYIFM